jgi:opacity protein-like surface antigen
MKNHPFSSFRRAARLALALATVMMLPPALRADDPGADFTLEAGPTLGQLDASGTEADLQGFHAGVKWELADLLMTGLSLKADYLHLESQDNFVFTRDQFDLDARLGMSLVGFLNPYLSAGASTVNIESPGYTAEDGWTPGYALGAGVGITILPALLHTTPAVRYVQYDQLETITYSLDTSLHFTVLGVGLLLQYEDNLDADAQIAMGTIYASLRF